MIRPIDVECPRCKEPAGRYCTSSVAQKNVDVSFQRMQLTFHHAERVDAAFERLSLLVDAVRSSENP
jgi:hypothetical protein